MSRYTLKSSTVFVSIGEETRVFRSVDEVPAEWIRYFERSKGRLRPETILIADPRGREEILRGLQGLPSSVRPRWNRSQSSLLTRMRLWLREPRNVPNGRPSKCLQKYRWR